MLWVLISYTRCLSATDSAQILHYTIENGLPSNNVYSIIQDSKGYLWFATDNGIIKYNGYTFRVFNTNDGLPSNDVFTLFEDTRGRIWIMNYAYEIGYIKDDTYFKLKLKSHHTIIKGSQFIEKDGYVYFHYKDSVNYIIAQIDSADNFKTFIVNGAAVLHSSGIGYSIYNQNQIYRNILYPDKITSEKLCDIPYTYMTVISTVKLLSKELLAEYTYKGNELFVHDLVSCKRRQINIQNYGADPTEQIHILIPENDTVLMITNKAIYNLDRNLFLESRVPISGILPVTSQISSRFSDYFKNVWYTTTSDGAWVYTRLQNTFHEDPVLNELFNSRCLGSIHDGTSFWWNSKLKKMVVVNPDLKVLFVDEFDSQLKYVTEADNNSVYLVFSKGVYKYDLRTKQKIHVADNGKKLFVKKMLPDRRYKFEEKSDSSRYLFFNYFSTYHPYDAQKAFAITAGAGIEQISTYKDSFIIQTLDIDKYTGEIYDSLNNKFWFYNAERLLIMNPDNNSSLLFNSEMLHSLGISSIADIKMDDFYNVYILSSNKITVLNTKLKKLTYLYTNVDLAGANLSIYRNKLILAGKFGLSYASISGPLSIRNFRIAPNIKNNYFNRVYDLFINKRGNIIVNTDKNVYSLNVDELFAENAAFTVKDRNFIKLVISSPHQYAVENYDTIRLPQGTEKINFDLINYYGIGGRQYTFKIGDNDWQKSETGEVFIGNLKSGNYYKVTCNMADDAWKNNVVVFYIYIAPYWWQTSVWRTVVLVGAILLLIGFLSFVVLVTRYYVAKANEKKRAIIELELRALYAQINPHFIFNTLGSALYFINKKNFEDAYIHINKFSRLLRSYLKSSQERYVTLEEELDMLKNYIELQQIRFEEKFDYAIEIENKIPSKNIQIPSLLLQPLVENAINHGLFHKEGRGFLLLSFSQGDLNDELVCTIEDDGVGRERAREINMSSVVQHDSYGTKLTHQLIDIFKKYEHMHIFLEYIDKEAPETGTIVKLVIRNVKYVA